MKKSLSLILALALVFTMFASVVSAADPVAPAATPTPVTATVYTPETAFEALKAAGIVEGDPVKGADLTGNLTRAQFAKVIAKLWELKELPEGSTVYSDLSGAGWAAGYIGAATKAGLLNGVGGGKFNPSGNVKLEEIAKVIATGFKLPAVAYAGTGKVSTWAKGYVGAVVGAKLVDDSADFTKAAKRSEIFTIGIKGYVAYQASKGPVATPTPTPAAFALSAVASSTNTSVKVTLKDAVTAVDKSQFAIQSFAKVDLAVSAATLSADGKVVTLTTAAQKAYGAYTLTAGGKSKTFVGLPVDTTKATFTGATDTYVSYVVTFNEEVSAATATNVANYKIDNSLTVVKAALDATGKIVTLTTSAQSVGVVYGLTVSGVADLSGNVIDSATVYFGGLAKDTVNQTVYSLTVMDYNKVVVVFGKKADPVSATNVANYVLDNNLTVLKAEIDTVDTTGKTVNLTTSDQSVGIVYKIVISNVKDTLDNNIDTVTNTKYFGGIAKDLGKPVVDSVQVTDNTKVTVTFRKAVEVASATNVANYTLDNSLTVTKAELNAAGTVVSLTTSAQSVGIVYGLTVANVKSALGTTMDSVTNYFGGIAKDVAAPTITVATSTGDTKLTIQYGEKVDLETATTLTNYSFDGDLGYPIGATLDTDGTNMIVTLTTAPQTAGKVYNVTVTGVADLNANATAAVVKSFVGKATSTASVIKYVGASVVDYNTVDLLFDNEVTDAAITNLSVTPNITVSNLIYKAIIQANKKIVRVQFAINNGNANPNLFAQGQVYTAAVAGVTGLDSSTTAVNIRSFGGTSIANALPEIKTAIPVDSTSVKVIFTEPVKNINNNTFTVNGLPTTTSVATTGDVVTEAILYYTPATAQGTINNLELITAFSDAAGYNFAVASVSGAKVIKTFGGTNVVNVAPTIVTTIPVDKYNFKIIFSEAVNGTDAKNATYTITGGTVTLLTYSKSLDDDGKTLNVRLNAAGGALSSGTVYTVNVATGSVIHDLSGLTLDTAATANTKQLGGSSLDNAKPTISGVSVNNKVLTVTFSEDIRNTTFVPSDFTITKADGTVVTGNVAWVDSKTVTITLATALTSQIAKIHANATITDLNGQSAVSDDLQFGVQ
ncbi:S-layer homology domain-containing protein [Paenibacillus psychroresistens]|nr:S-layer homology domain-containing protein [Paenibacillus psychroresistens]